jgi:hypothetical protein
VSLRLPNDSPFIYHHAGPCLLRPERSLRPGLRWHCFVFFFFFFFLTNLYSGIQAQD